MACWVRSRCLAHAKAELGIVLEEGVGPGGAFTLGVHRVGEGGVGAAPNGGAACGVGDDQTLTEELRHELHMGRLTAALAGPREFQKRLLELRALAGKTKKRKARTRSLQHASGA